MTWPKKYGGHERSFLERFVVTEEMRVANAPVRLHFVADRQSGPILLKYAPEHIKQDILPRICRGELCFVIGMSEPNSGSDLFAAKTKATKVDGGWKINGTKIWTSNAHIADYMLGLFRTSPPTKENRRHGLTQFLVDMKIAGHHGQSDHPDDRPARFQRGRVRRRLRAGRSRARRTRWRLETGDQRTRLRAQRAGAFSGNLLRAGRTGARARARTRLAQRRRARPPGGATAYVAPDVGLGRRHVAGRQGAGGGILDRQGRRHHLGAETARPRARSCRLSRTGREQPRHARRTTGLRHQSRAQADDPGRHHGNPARHHRARARDCGDRRGRAVPDIAKLLWPKTVAVVGASSDKHGLRGRILETMLSHPFDRHDLSGL